MAKGTEQRLFLTLAEAYKRAVMTGASSIDMHIGWVEEVLEYLESENTDTRKVFLPLDDYKQEDIEKAFLAPVPVVEKTDTEKLQELQVLYADLKAELERYFPVKNNSCTACHNPIVGTVFHVNHKGKNIKLCETCSDKHHQLYTMCDICGRNPRHYRVDMQDGNSIQICQDCYEGGSNV